MHRFKFSSRIYLLILLPTIISIYPSITNIRTIPLSCYKCDNLTVPECASSYVSSKTAKVVNCNQGCRKTIEAFNGTFRLSRGCMPTKNVFISPPCIQHFNGSLQCECYWDFCNHISGLSYYIGNFVLIQTIKKLIEQ
ncbi:hypothetical protein ACOME3_004103 [Neoechinorhynchus agilis]